MVHQQGLRCPLAEEFPGPSWWQWRTPAKLCASRLHSVDGSVKERQPPKKNNSLLLVQSSPLPHMGVVVVIMCPPWHREPPQWLVSRWLAFPWSTQRGSEPHPFPAWNSAASFPNMCFSPQTGGPLFGIYTDQGTLTLTIFRTDSWFAVPRMFFFGIRHTRPNLGFCQAPLGIRSQWSKSSRKCLPRWDAMCESPIVVTINDRERGSKGDFSEGCLGFHVQLKGLSWLSTVSHSSPHHKEPREIVCLSCLLLDSQPQERVTCGGWQECGRRLWACRGPV